MQIMNGWTIDQYDLAAGVVALCGLVVIAMCVRVLKQLYDFDVAAEECRDDCCCCCPGTACEVRVTVIRDDCYCANSGQQDQAEACGSCGRYCETGHGE